MIVPLHITMARHQTIYLQRKAIGLFHFVQRLGSGIGFGIMLFFEVQG